MTRYVLGFSFVLVVLAGVVLGVKVEKPAHAAVGLAPGREFPMAGLEPASARHVLEEVARLRNDIARIASGSQENASELMAVAAAVQQLDRDDEELRREAEKRLGVAVVQSGTLWVERK